MHVCLHVMYVPLHTSLFFRFLCKSMAVHALVKSPWASLQETLLRTTIQLDPPIDFQRRSIGNLESMLDSSMIDEHGPVRKCLCRA